MGALLAAWCSLAASIVVGADAPGVHRTSSLMARGQASAHPRLRAQLERAAAKSSRHPRSAVGGPGACPAAARDEIERTGRLSVATQGAAGNATGWRFGPAEGPWLE
jgi:hypothetical protein